MTTSTFLADGILDDHVSRFLGGVFGPLGPVATMRAYGRALDRMDHIYTSTSPRRDAVDRPTITESAFRLTFGTEHVPDYLRGVSRAQLGSRMADYVDAHRDLVGAEVSA